MKAAKRRRDPSKEPFASPYTDEQRRAMYPEILVSELIRATRKSEAARQQAVGGRVLFVEPTASDVSASATVAFAMGRIKKAARAGRVWRNGQKLGGNARGKQKTIASQPRYDRICKQAAGILSDCDLRQVVSETVKEYHWSATTVRRALQKDPSGHWATALRKKTAS